MLSKMRVEAERVWVNMTSATSNGQLMKDELAKKLQQVLDQACSSSLISVQAKASLAAVLGLPAPDLRAEPDQSLRQAQR